MTRAMIQAMDAAIRTDVKSDSLDMERMGKIQRRRNALRRPLQEAELELK